MAAIIDEEYDEEAAEAAAAELAQKAAKEKQAVFNYISYSV